MGTLTDRECRNAKPRANAYELAAGSVGEVAPRFHLKLRVWPSGAKVWTASYRFGGLREVRDRKGNPVLQASGKPKLEQPRQRITIGDYHPTGTAGGKGYTLAEARERALELRAAVLRGEDPNAKATAGDHLTDMVERYYEGAGRELRPKTLNTYRIATNRFLAWAKANGVTAAGDLTRKHLQDFRAYLVGLPKHAAEPKGKRGQKRDTGATRSSVSVNRELRTMKTILNHWRAGGELPNLDRDALTDCLKAMAVERSKPAFLKHAQLEKLLRACMRHDAAVFAETREEHAGLRPVGTTPRYLPIAPFTVFLLLTGCRRGEALRLRWADVDLDAVDDAGEVAGEFSIYASEAKTKHERSVYLEVSPALRRMLATMRATTTGERVFEGYSGTLVDAARRRLLGEYGAPAFDWQMLRSTCATFLTNSPGIFGASVALYKSARQLGHSVAVAERHYLGNIRGIAREVTTLEAAMRIESVLREATSGTGDVVALRVANGGKA